VVAVGGLTACVRGHARDEVGAQRECAECHRQRQRLWQRLVRLERSLKAHVRRCRLDELSCLVHARVKRRLIEARAELDAWRSSDSTLT
jgi:hypothetical protein